MKKRIVVLVIVLALLAPGCARVSSPFSAMRPDYSRVPEDSLRAAARALEEAAARGDREPELETFPGVVLDTPEIRQAMRARAARAELVHELLDSGNAYEQRSGTIRMINTREYRRSTSSRKRDQNAMVVMSENQNRWALYEGILKASEWSPGALGAVQHIFFEARQPLLAPGHKYEDEQGNIVRK